MTLPSDPTKIQPITSTINRTAEDLCDTICDTGDCSTRCKYACPQYCQDYVPVSEPIIPFDDNGDHHHKTSSLLIAMLSLIGATLLILGIYIAYVKIQNSRRRRHQESRIIRTDESDDVSDIDEDQGTVVDHPIWYIRTVGLQPSVISSIMVFKYKKGEGLIEGTECSVCLTEFDEDETLRLLPKCSHAFHVPCIDTWLRSHTNCPMCRAPIVANSVSRVQAVEQDSGNENLAVEEGIREENPVGNDGSSRDMESGVQELRIGIEGYQELDSQGGRKRHEVDRIQPVRRSVSLDCLAASKISLAVSNVLPVQSGKSSGVGKFGGKSSGGNVRVGNSSSGRYLQNGPGLMRRSLSLSGQILQSVYSRSQSSVLPL